MLHTPPPQGRPPLRERGDPRGTVRKGGVRQGPHDAGGGRIMAGGGGSHLPKRSETTVEGGILEISDILLASATH